MTMTDVPAELHCGAVDGYSLCTEPPGHPGNHYDRITDHEWSRDDDE